MRTSLLVYSVAKDNFSLNNVMKERGEVMNANHLVTQSNDLIEARHTHPLSAREQKIVLTVVSMIQPNDDDFQTYEIYIRHFHEMLGLEGREHYTQIKEVVKDLMTKVIEIPSKDGGWILTHWASHVEYKTGEGMIEFAFDPKLRPYLLQLKQAFTSYRLSNILSLKSAYSIRLYELMKKWQHIGKWEVSVDSLREKMGVTKGKYPQYANLKQRVLTPSVKEMNKKTDVQVSFKEIRKGRKVMKIEFIIQHYKEREITIDKPKKEEFDRNLFDDLRDLSEFELSLSGFKKLERIAKSIYHIDEYIGQLKLLVKAVNSKFKQGDIDNPVGLMIHIIEDKQKLYEKGYSAKIEDISSEVVPDWFNDQKGQRHKKKKTHEQKSMKEQQAEREELERLLAEFRGV